MLLRIDAVDVLGTIYRCTSVHTCNMLITVHSTSYESLLIQRFPDLRGEALWQASMVPSCSVQSAWLKGVGLMQGACDTPPSESMMANLNFTEPPQVKLGQCLLVSNTAMLTGEGNDLLLENFVVSLLPNNKAKQIFHPILSFFKADVYLSKITLHGSDVQICVGGGCGLYTEDSNVALEGAS